MLRVHKHLMEAEQRQQRRGGSGWIRLAKSNSTSRLKNCSLRLWQVRRRSYCVCALFDCCCFAGCSSALHAPRTPRRGPGLVQVSARRQLHHASILGPALHAELSWPGSSRTAPELGDGKSIDVHACRTLASQRHAKRTTIYSTNERPSSSGRLADRLRPVPVPSPPATRFI